MQPDHPRNPRPTSRARRNQFNSPIIGNPGQMANFVVSRTTSRKRPVDKLLINVIHSALDSTQQTTTLVTATFPCTVVGLRWDLSVITAAGTNPASYGWAIVIVRDGITVSGISFTDGGTFFSPEQDVLAFAHGINPQDNQGTGRHYNGSTKTMRKLMGGDKLMFLSKGQATETSNVTGTIQFFCKS